LTLVPNIDDSDSPIEIGLVESQQMLNGACHNTLQCVSMEIYIDNNNRYWLRSEVPPLGQKTIFL
ncbi:hypothetical protein SK128_019307, partial [Halocaridina rubra]